MNLTGAIDSDTTVKISMPARNLIDTKNESCYKVGTQLAHKKVQNEPLKQWMQCMQSEIFSGNLVLVDFKGLHQG
jgi:hypothetical protein